MSAEGVMRNGKLLNKLYARGWHAHISIICAVHEARSVVNPIIRATATALMIVRQSSGMEAEAFSNKIMRSPTKKHFTNITGEQLTNPINLTVLLDAKTVDDMCA